MYFCASNRDVLRYQGQEYDIIALDEATQLTEFQFSTFKACLRGTNGIFDRIKASGLSVKAVGKITDIFAGQGITESILTHSNKEGMEVTEELIGEDFSGLVFTNLVEFDSSYGHRQNVDGYAAAISEFDGWLGGFLQKLGEDDALIITADHGCDPGDSHTDHTREYVPYLLYGNGIEPKNLGTLDSFTYVGEAVEALLGLKEDEA